MAVQKRSYHRTTSTTRSMICLRFLPSLAMWLFALTLTKHRFTAAAFRAAPNHSARLYPSASRLFTGAADDSADASAARSSTLEKFANKNNVRDQCISALSGDGSIKVTVATIRNIINDMSLQHTMTPVPTDALGRTVTCGLLMANGMQDEQTVQITMNGM